MVQRKEKQDVGERERELGKARNGKKFDVVREGLVERGGVKKVKLHSGEKRKGEVKRPKVHHCHITCI